MTYELSWTVGGTLTFEPFKTFETLDSFYAAMVRAGHIAVGLSHDVTVRKLERRDSGYSIIWSIEVRRSEVVVG